VVEGLIQVSVRQTKSGWWQSIRSETAAEWSGCRIERILTLTDRPTLDWKRNLR